MRDSDTFQNLVDVASLQQEPPFSSLPRPKLLWLTPIYIAPCGASADYNGSELWQKVAGRPRIELGSAPSDGAVFILYTTRPLGERKVSAVVRELFARAQQSRWAGLRSPQTNKW